MIFGGLQDVGIFFDLTLVTPWHSIPPTVGLICGLIVLVVAGMNLIWGWWLRSANSEYERTLAKKLVVVNIIAIIADWISGYYGFGCLMAFLVSVWLVLEKKASEIQ